MSHKFRSYPVPTLLSVMFNQPLDPVGDKRILSMLSFMLCDNITMKDLNKAIEYAGPKLQSRFSKYFTPSMSEKVKVITKKLNRIKKSKSNYKEIRIERLLEEFQQHIAKIHSKTGSVKNRPFAKEKQEWLKFKSS